MKKQKIWFMITFLIVICMTYYVNATNYELGDVNQDGEVSIKDAVLVHRYAAGWNVSFTPEQLALADVTGDNLVDLRDAYMIRRKVAKWDITFPVEVAQLGDINQDGKVSSKDTILLEKHLAGTETLTELKYALADVTGDGVVTKCDLAMIKRKLAGYDIAFPVKIASMGDLNEDGVIDSKDVAILTQHLENQRTLSDMEEGLADVVSDGIIDEFDLMVLKRKVAGEDLQIPIDPTILGDVDQDGDITLKDSALLHRYLHPDWDVSLTKEQLAVADVTCDGIIDGRDVACIKLKVAKWIEKFPVAVAAYGDINEDGVIDSKDTVLLQKYLAGETTFNQLREELANVRQDEVVDKKDLELLLKYLAGYSVVLPVKAIHYGDINEDGKVDALDLEILEKYINQVNTNLSKKQKELADVTCDGKIDRRDMRILQAKILNQYTGDLPVFVSEYGDINEDGVVDSKDSVALTKYLEGEKNLSLSQQIVADVTLNGEITKTDLQLILRKLAGYSIELPHKMGEIGDLNKDGAIDGKDYVALKRYIEVEQKPFLSEHDRILYNMNCDNTIDQKDLIALGKMVKIVEGITLNQTSLTFHNKENKTLSVVITPNTAANQTIAWTSSDTKVATVNADGVVIPVGNGNCTITAKTTDGSNLEKTCRVEVKILHFTNIRVEPEEIKFTNRKAKKVKVTVESAISKEIGFSSSNPQIVTVNKEGVVTPIKSGECVITVKALDGTEVQKEIPVQVTLPYIVGNFDQNERVDVTDAYLLLNKIVNNTEITKEVEEIVDMNADGKIDVTDAYLLLELLTQMF